MVPVCGQHGVGEEGHLRLCVSHHGHQPWVQEMLLHHDGEVAGQKVL